jgi:hypothetical protein
MLHQRRFPPRDVSRNNQPQRGQERSLSRGRPTTPSTSRRAFSFWGRHDPVFDLNEIMLDVDAGRVWRTSE